jgi:UPF0716 family protein affecting phage T7 exclusion
MSLKLDISINSGAALALFVPCFFGLVTLAAFLPAVERIFAVALAGMVGAFSGYLLKKNADNQKDIEAARGGFGDELNKIKVQASQPASCESGKQGPA